MLKSFSIILPAFNESEGIGEVIRELKRLGERENFLFEIIIVDDGSTDNTAEIAAGLGAKIISHPVNIGYGRSLKDGIIAAENDNIIITDADGTYPIKEIPQLIKEFEKGFDMVVGARQGREYRGTFLKMPARYFFKLLSEFAAGVKIPDINSGLRIFKRSAVAEYFRILCNGFSFTTTITLAYFLTGRSIKYMPIEYHKRAGSSKVRYFRDTLRTLQIIVEAILYFNPIKIFLVLAALVILFGFVILIFGIIFHIRTFFDLFAYSIIGSIIIFAMGLQADLLRRIKEK